MAVRTMDIPVGRRRFHVPAALVRFATNLGERRRDRKALRRLMADRVTGRETGARI